MLNLLLVSISFLWVSINF